MLAVSPELFSDSLILGDKFPNLKDFSIIIHYQIIQNSQIFILSLFLIVRRK